MKKKLFIILILILLALIGGNLFLLCWISRYICGNRIVRLDDSPAWKPMALPVFPDIENWITYKINNPDSAIFFRKDKPQSFLFSQKGKNILRVNNAGHEYSVTYCDLQEPQYFVDWTELKNGPRVLEVTWRETTYYDFNGDMIFDLLMAPRNKEPHMYSVKGEWKSCKILNLRDKIIQDGNSIYVFRNGQWQTEKPENRE